MCLASPDMINELVSPVHLSNSATEAKCVKADSCPKMDPCNVFLYYLNSKLLLKVNSSWFIYIYLKKA